MKRRTDAWIGGTIASIGIAVMIWVIPSQIEGSEDASIPPSLIANLSMGLTVFLSLLLMVRAMVSGDPESGPLVGRSSWKWLAFVTASLLISGFLVELFGFFYGGMFVIVGYMLCMGERRLRMVLPISVGFAGLCYGVLAYGLRIL